MAPKSRIAVGGVGRGAVAKAKADGNGGARKAARSLHHAMAQQDSGGYNGGAGRLRPGHVSDNSTSPPPPRDRGGYVAQDQDQFYGQDQQIDRPARPRSPVSGGQLQQRPNYEVNWNQDAGAPGGRPSLKGAFGTFSGTVQHGGAPPSPGTPSPKAAPNSIARPNSVPNLRPQASAPPAETATGKGRGRGAVGRGVPQAVVRGRGGRGERASFVDNDYGYMDPLPQTTEARYAPPPQVSDDLYKVKDRIQHAIAHNSDSVRKSIGSRGMLSEPELRNVVRKQLKISHKEVSDTQLARLMDAYDTNRNGKIGLDQMLEKSEAPNDRRRLETANGGTPTNSKTDFGFGDRLDAAHFNNLKDQLSHGGYYKAAHQFSDHLQEKEQKKREFDEKLLHVTSTPGSPLHKRSMQLHMQSTGTPDNASQVSEASTRGRSQGAIARTTSPMPPVMGSAFTDRSLRMRENHNALAFGDSKLAKKAERLEAERNQHMRDCKCPACRPFDVKAAGQISTLVQHNRMPVFYGTIDRQVLAEEAGDDIGPLKAFGNSTGEDKPRNNPMDSSLTKLSMQHTYYDNRDQDKISRDAAQISAVQGHQDISSHLGRKRRVPTAIRSLSEDTEQWGAAAGFYRQDGAKSRNSEFSRLAACDSIGNIVPGLSEGPRGNTILSEGVNKDQGKKGNGAYSTGFSPMASRLAVQNNASLLRYEADVQILRSTSCPPDVARSRWNPLTHAGDPHGGLAYMEARTHQKIIDKDPAFSSGTVSARGSYARSPSRDSERSAHTTSGAPHSQCAGVSSHTFSERKFKQWRGGSPRPTLHMTWDSSSVGQVIGDHVQLQAAEERTRRLSVDSKFAQLCKATEVQKANAVQQVQDIKDKVNHHHSHQVASTLQWEG